MPTVTGPVLQGRWRLSAVVCVLYFVAGGLNAGPLLAGARPAVAGVLASAAYGAVWLVWAFVAGSFNNCRTMRGMAGFWAVVIAIAAICSTFVRLDARSGVAASGWMVASLLMVAAAPLYGLAGVLTGEPLMSLTAVAVAAGGLTMTIAATARSLAPAAS